mmetsp:Transcript_10804/g.12361  ORF Transcript_10804/g.12361 Transcript_10804/m.12361 type:complete len:278 (+) Transcript_10804:67-900(+)
MAARGEGIEPLFMPNEGWAAEDWKETQVGLSKLEIQELEPDIVLRTVRGSHFLKDRKKRIARNIELLKGRVAWYTENDVSNALSSEILPTTKLFRQTVLPIRIYGANKEGNPLLVFNLKETDWYRAQKEINADDLLRLVIRTLESMMDAVTSAGCHGVCTDPAVHVQGKYIAVFDLEGLSWSKLRSANSLGLKSLMTTCAKFYPETVLKTYILNSYIVKAVITMLSPFIAPDTRSRISVCSDAAQFVKRLKENDDVSDNDIPADYGGKCEGTFCMKC